MKYSIIKTRVNPLILLLLLLLPSHVWAQDDVGSLEAMIKNHKTVRTVLEVRAISELGAYT